MKLFKREKSGDKRIITFLGLKFSYTKKHSNHLNEWDILMRVNKMIDNLKYEIKGELNDIVLPIVKSKDELLELLINSQVSLVRYGDGEYRLMQGGGPEFQKYEEELSNRLKEILKIDDRNIIVGITDIFGSLSVFTDDVVMAWRGYLAENRDYIYSFLDMEKVYYDSLVTRPYISYKNKENVAGYFEKIKKIWQDKELLIVEGIGSRLGIGNDLFDNAKSIERILCPAENSFSKYDEIFDICRKQNKNKMFILALGPTATVLAYDLYKEGFRALDLGHVDIEYEWFLMKADKKVPIPGKYICANEIANATSYSNENDGKYVSQIIYEIKD